MRPGVHATPLQPPETQVRLAIRLHALGSWPGSFIALFYEFPVPALFVAVVGSLYLKALCLAAASCTARLS